jgi:5-methylcytosine-specific restriction endonuclease McrA
MGRSTRYREKIRPLAFARDKKADAPCWICGQKIDYLAQISTTPDSWEGDHVNAVANGGEELDLKNVRACHKRCNRVRGAGDNNNVIGQQSRIW